MPATLEPYEPQQGETQCHGHLGAFMGLQGHTALPTHHWWASAQVLNDSAEPLQQSQTQQPPAEAELSAEPFPMALSLCGLRSRETTYNKPLCGKLCLFKASFTAKGKKASVFIPPHPETQGSHMRALHLSFSCCYEKEAPRNSMV